MRPVIVVVVLLFSSAVAAQDLFQRFANTISDQAAQESTALALTKIQTATCENNKPCAPARPEEIKAPPITIADSRAAMTFAIQSALAQWCGLDFQRSFLPMIAFGKGHKKMSDRQLQLMTLIHGDFMGRQLAFYSKSGKSCPDHLRSQLDASLPKLNR